MQKILGILLGLLLTASFAYAGGITSATNPAGANTQIQFNNAGAFGADSNLTYANDTETLTTDILNLPTSSSAEGYLTVNGIKAFHLTNASATKDNNLFVGPNVGNVTLNNANGFNFCLGIQNCQNMTSAYYNLIAGSNSQITTGYQNVAVGINAGYGVTTGLGNINIGYYAGGGSGNYSNRFFLDNNNDTTPFLYGELDTERLGIETNAPTARFHLPAGIATAGYAPLKIDRGTNLTTTETGAIEHSGSAVTSNFYLTKNISSTATRGIVSLQTPTAFTAGSILFADSNGFLEQDNTGLFWDNTNNYLGLGTATPTHGVHVVMPAATNFYIDATTNPRTMTEGVLRIDHKPDTSTPGTSPLVISVDSNSVADTHAVRINYTATNMAAGNESYVQAIHVNTDASTGGEVKGYRIDKSGVGTANVEALCVGSGVEVVHQHSGVAVAIEKAFTYNTGTGYTDVTTAFGSTATDVQLFGADDDYVYIGQASTFSDINTALAIKSSHTIIPIFQYSAGAGVWTTFTPNDGTTGFTSTGVITWTMADLTGWTTDTVNGVGSKYWIRIQRTRNSLPTPPTEDKVDVTATTSYTWDENGNISLNKVTSGGLVMAVSTKTTAYTIDDNDYTVLANTTSAGFTVTLPASPTSGMIVNVKKISTDVNTLTIGRNGNNIEGSASDLTTAATNRPNYTLQYISGSGWWIL